MSARVAGASSSIYINEQRGPGQEHPDGRADVPDGRAGVPGGRVCEFSADFSPIKSPLKVSLLEKLAKMSQIRILGCPELDFHRLWMRFG